jgi:intracellular septation protein
LEQKSVALKSESPPLLKLGLEIGPLLIFFGTNAYAGIYNATAAFMVATVFALAGSKILLKRIAPVAIISAGFVIVFGSLTLYLKDDTFIKMKVTVINLLFAAMLGAGLYFGRPLLKFALGEVMHLRDEGWRILTLRWMGFFTGIAVLNEIIWRSTDTNTWIKFKSFGIIPLTFLFMMSQFPLLMKYQLEEKVAETDGNSS